MAAKRFNLKTCPLRGHDELEMENDSLRSENKKLRAEVKEKDRVIQELSQKLNIVGKKKSVRFLSPPTIVTERTGKEQVVSSPEKVLNKNRANQDLLEKDHFTGYFHKFLEQKTKDSRSRCDRCGDCMARNEKISQCIFCLENFHKACAQMCGQNCLSRGSVPPRSQKEVRN